MKRINGKQLIIFDCDGVLFHSEDANMAYFETCLEKTARVPLKGNLRKQAAYMSVRQLFQQILDNPSDVEEAYQISQKIPYDPYLPLIKPTFNFDELLLPVKEEKYLAIATNRGQSLTKLFKYFNLFKYFHYKVSAYDNPRNRHRICFMPAVTTLGKAPNQLYSSVIQPLMGKQHLQPESITFILATMIPSIV